MDNVYKQQWLWVCETCANDADLMTDVYALGVPILPLDLSEHAPAPCALCSNDNVPYRTFFTPESMIAENEQCMATKATPGKIIKIGKDLGDGKVGH